MAANELHLEEMALLRCEIAALRGQHSMGVVALANAEREVVDLRSQLAEKRHECIAAYADRNRYRESFETISREAATLRESIVRAEAERDLERTLRLAAESRAAAAEQQNVELARERITQRLATSDG